VKRATKIIGAVLLTAFVTVSVVGVFPAPQKAEAAGVGFAACLAAKIADALGAALKAVPASILSVNTSDIINTEGTAEAAGGQNWVMCFLKGLAVTIARTLLHTFTQSIVNWINRGFEGEPSFVTDVGGFFTDVADQAFGEVIGLISPLLCSPFRFDIKASLGLQASLSGTEQIRCRLSDVFANVDGGFQQFVSGSFSSGGGWNSWINISGTPQNNPYGAHLNTQSYVGARIVTATGKEIKLLEFGDGFKSWRPCKVPGDPIVVKDRDGKPKENKDGTQKTRKGPCKEYGEIRTPGSVIASSANASLNSTLEELQVADDIDAVVGALINQLMIKAVTGVGGLLGASKSDSTSGGASATGSLATDPLKVRASAEMRPPAGIDCTQRYYPSVVVTLNGIRPNDSENIVYTDQFVEVPLLNSRGEEEKDADGNVIKRKVVAVVDGQTLTVPAKDVYGKELLKEDWKFGAGQTWEEYFEIVRIGCQNETIRILDSETDIARSESGTNVTAPNAPKVTTPAKTNQTVKGNIAQNKLVTQISVYQEKWREYGPQNLTDGNIFGDATYGTAFTKSHSEQKWFVIDLESYGASQYSFGTNGSDLTNTEISEIKIYGPTGDFGNWGRGAYSSKHPMTVYITKEDPLVVDVRSLTNPAYKGYIYLQSTDSNHSVMHQVNYDEVRGDVSNDRVISSIKPLNPVKGGFVTVLSPPVTKVGRDWYYHHFGLTEVEVFGTQTRIDPNNPDASVTPPEQEFQVQLNPSSINLSRARAGDSIGSNASLNLTATKVGPGISLRIKMYEKDGGVSNSADKLADATPYKDAPTPLYTYFQNLSVSVTQDGVASTTILVYPARTPTLCASRDPCMNASLPTPKTNTYTFDENRILPVNKVVPVTIRGQYKSSLAQNTFRFVIEAVDNKGTVLSTGEMIAKTQAP